jgi:hemerythrin-like metal-binding protein
MPLLNWRAEYSVNEELLDNHHRQLFSILNTVYENVMNSLEVCSVLPLIDELLEYTRSHFTVEEQHMRDKGYQVIDIHISKHREFTNTIEAMKTHYNGNNLEAAQELMVVLGEWLLQHVLKDDMKYSQKGLEHY